MQTSKEKIVTKKLRDKTLKIESKAPFLNASPVKIPIIMLTIP